MGRIRTAAAVSVLVLALVAGAACTGPPPTAESVGRDLGYGIGLVLTVILANIACALNPSCSHPTCALFPCAVPPSAQPGTLNDVEPVSAG